MAIDRLISKRRYFLAGVFTLLFFLLGISLGMIFDNARVQSLNKESRAQELNYKSLQLQYLMLNSFQNNVNTCSLLTATLDDAVKQLAKSLEKIENYKKDGGINGGEYSLLHRQYILDNVQYWQFAQRAKEQCGIDLVNIMYFYSSTKCSLCPNQGVLLTFFKKTFGDSLLIFPIDVDVESEERMVSIIKQGNNVSKYPALLLDDLLVQGDVVQKEELRKLICSHFKKPREGCADEN